MKIAIVGPGAMGCLFATRLVKGGIQTTLVDYLPDRAARLQASGIRLEENGTTQQAQLAVTTSIPHNQDVVIVLVKAYATDRLQFPSDVPILTLQNGLGNVETLCGKVGSARVLAGTTSEGATLLGEGHVRHGGSGKTFIGSWTSCPVDKAYDALKQAQFDVEVTDAPGQRIWEKAAINAGINPLTSLLNVQNGRLVEIPEVRQLMRDLVVEAAKVAAIEGYKFTSSLVESAEEICRQTSTNLSSMLQDLRAGKKTEIDALSGEIMRRALNASLPIPRTRVILQLIKGLEYR